MKRDKDLEKIIKALKKCGREYLVITMKELPNCKHIDTKTKKLVLGCPPNRTAH